MKLFATIIVIAIASTAIIQSFANEFLFPIHVNALGNPHDRTKSAICERNNLMLIEFIFTC